MVTTSAMFLRASMMAGLLAAGATAFAADVPPDGSHNQVRTGGVAVVTPDAFLPKAAAVTSLPAIPIREWQFEIVPVKEPIAWQGGRSLGALPRVPRLPRPRGGSPHSPAYKGVQRILAGAALGTLGMVVGTAAGALMGSAGCGCEDGALYGMVIGAPVGAAAGATLGVMLTR
jgi:hypothetical protein